jgi:hypothetical protein
VSNSFKRCSRCRSYKEHCRCPGGPRRILPFILAAALSGCATIKIPESESTWQMMNVIDVGMTIHTLKLPCATEWNPVITGIAGQRPNNKELIALASAGAALHMGVSQFLVSRDMKKTYRVWQSISLTGTGFAIGTNVKMKLKGCPGY